MLLHYGIINLQQLIQICIAENFLKACKKADLEIEGGLFYVKSNSVLKEMPDYPKYKEEYKDFIYENRLSMDEYIKKTKESVLVFNTPSVCECHGWKLAEYLCMGKAIISTLLLARCLQNLFMEKIFIL